MKVVLFIISANSIEAQHVSANWRAIQKKNMTRLNFVLLHTTIIHKKLKVLNPIFFIIFYLFEKRKMNALDRAETMLPLYLNFLNVRWFSIKISQR